MAIFAVQVLLIIKSKPLAILSDILKNKSLSVNSKDNFTDI